MSSWFSWLTPTDPSMVRIQTATQSGNVPFTSNMSLPRSNNQAEGAVFTFDGWFDIENFESGFGRQRMIFSRGDCPGLYIDSTSNSIIVKVATFGGHVETVLIENIPAQKWVHFAIVVSQYTVDTYINGMLKIHHTLTSLPKQVDEPIQIAGNAFTGQVGGLTYYARALSPTEISTHASSAPPPSLVNAPPSGGYFATQWFTG